MRNHNTARLDKKINSGTSYWIARFIELISQVIQLICTSIMM